MLKQRFKVRNKISYNFRVLYFFFKIKLEKHSNISNSEIAAKMVKKLRFFLSKTNVFAALVCAFRKELIKLINCDPLYFQNYFEFCQA